MKLGRFNNLGGETRLIAGPPLDVISVHPNAAWGARKLSSSYTGAACYAYNSDGSATDVYFDHNNEVSLKSPTNWTGSANLRDFSALTSDGNVFVGTWYDQTTGTNTLNATQTTSSERPLLLEAGEMRKKGLRFIDDYFKVENYRFPNPNDSCTILAVAATKGGTYGVITDIEAYDDGVELIYAASEWSWRIKNSDLEDNPVGVGADLQLAIAMYDTSLGSRQQTLRVNGVGTSKNCSEDKHVASTDRFRIGARKTTDNQLNGWIGEGMIWDSAIPESDLLYLENNIFLHYSIP